MPLQPFAVAGATLDWFRRYVRASFPLRDPWLDEQRERLIDERLLWAEPYIRLERPGEVGPPLKSLGDVLLPETLAIPWGFSDLYQHQDRAIRRLAPEQTGGPKNTLILSGTGSGKTEGFLIPAIDACLREPGPGIKTVVVYPMNALANDQLKRLRELLAGTPDVTFGRYTGDTPETDAGDPRRPGRPADALPNHRWSRQSMRDQPPNILLTNYSMLEYLLLRRKDEELFQYGPPKYLVIDEIHLFAGILGAEVAALLRRFRQHVGGAEGGICMVGTSATAGNEEEEQGLVQFAERFFGASFGLDALVTELHPPVPAPQGVTPPTPAITDDMLARVFEPDGLSGLARATLDVDLSSDSDDTPAALGAIVDQFATVAVVERALARPGPLSAAAAALRSLPERAGATDEELLREAQAILLLGASALVQPVGEGEPEPRFRPRLHQFLRSLAGLSRCLDPAHGVLSAPDGSTCTCGSMTLSVASCRTCGEAYWTSPAPSLELASVHRLQAVEQERGLPSVFLADPQRLSSLVTEDEEGTEIRWNHAAACARCGGFGLGSAVPAHLPSCPTPTAAGVSLLASTDDVHCPACGDIGARNRPILLPLKGSAAASTAVLTQGLSDDLRYRTDEAGGRLLVFADSRQNAAQQAGYADDQGARIAVRQLITEAVRQNGPTSLQSLPGLINPLVLNDPAARRRWLVGESSRNFAEVSDPEYQMSPEDRKHIEQQISWEVALEVTERARRRFSLEQEGVVVVHIAEVEGLTSKVAAMWPDNPFPEPILREVIWAVIDVMRYGRAVSHWMLKIDPRSLVRNHGLRVGDRAINATRGYGKKKFTSRKDGVDIRAWSAPNHMTRMTELVGRVLRKPPTKVGEAIDSLAARLSSIGILTESTVTGRKRSMVDQGRIVLSLRDDEQLWRCNRCGAVRSACLRDVEGKALCINWLCPGTPVPFEPAPGRDFYRGQYLAPPRRLIVREHSGQIEGDERLALEARFNDRAHPIVDAIACTPTLEVGVSLDDLHAVVLRNLPPSPANYAQRVGRAGRRSKIALAVAHAGHGPHDSYFFERPGELIAGEVRAPAISIDNEPVLRRHVNSLVIEVLRLDLPARWVPELDASGGDIEPTIADEDGVLRESTLAPFAEKLGDTEVRAQVESAVRGAFASPHDPAPPDRAEEICLDQVERFLTDLRDALNRWCGRYRSLVEEWKKSLHAKGIPSKTEKDFQDRMYREIIRLASPSSPEYQPLGFLGLVGFLPRYGFTGASVLLHPSGSDEPLVQSAAFAVTEFAPGNIVYARGRRMKVMRLDPAPIEEASAGPEHRDNVVTAARRCDACEYLTTNVLEKACPTCHGDLIGQQVVALTGVGASGGSISSEDEYRRSSAYVVQYMLGPAQGPPEVVELAGYRIERSHGRSITVANRGLRTSKEGEAHGFELCIGCGHAAELNAPTDEDAEYAPDFEAPAHRPFCPARKDPHSELVKRPVWLTARIQGDAMEVHLPPAVRGEAFHSWRVTLGEALLLGIRETVQAGRRDLDGFARMQKGVPVSLVLYDSMPGGTGYLPKLFANGAAGLKAAAGLAAERLATCSCKDSCHRCLRDFWNQRYHAVLNRFEVIGTLRRLASGDAAHDLEAEDAKLESFLEQEFFERLSAAGLPSPTLQVVRVIGGRRIIRVDCEYRDPDVSIFLDGREYHTQSMDKVLDDLEVRNQLEASGTCVLEFTYKDVMSSFADVADAIRSALSGSGAAIEAKVGELPGLTIEAVDEGTHRIAGVVDPGAWIRDEEQRIASMHSANQLRLAGWRLERKPHLGS
jgi:hypothetical protein